MSAFRVLAVSLLLHCSPLAAQSLTSADCPALQGGLATVISDLGLDAAVQKGKLAITLVVATNPEQPCLAQLNGHKMFYAASLPKIAILLGAAHELEHGKLVLTPELDRDLHDMIRFSCNDCATRVLDQVGRQRLLNILQSPDYGFYEEDGSGGLWVGKAYGPEPAYRRDPIAGTSHGATAFQAARFYYLLHRRELVSADQSRMMLEILSRPGIKHKFVRGLSALPNLHIYRKSGTWKKFHADSALVESNGHAYIMVALAEDDDAAEWLESLAPRLHRLATSGLEPQTKH